MVNDTARLLTGTWYHPLSVDLEAPPAVQLRVIYDPAIHEPEHLIWALRHQMNDLIDRLRQEPTRDVEEEPRP